MKYYIVLLLSFFLLNCKSESSQKQSVQSIIDASIETSGGDKIASSTIEFDFRDIHYKANRHKGKFELERTFKDSASTYRDVLSNTSFRRYRDDKPMTVEDSMAVKYSASVNSVHYFSVLPFGLNDEAVNKELLEDVSIKNQKYHSVKVTFEQDGGGEDYEDKFIYWIHTETNKVHYLAYSYNESDGKGYRFREAYNERYVDGIRFVNYNNYMPLIDTVLLTNLPKLFEEGKLKLLSKIELETIVVTSN